MRTPEPARTGISAVALGPYSRPENGTGPRRTTPSAWRPIVAEPGPARWSFARGNARRMSGQTSSTSQRAPSRFGHQSNEPRHKNGGSPASASRPASGTTGTIGGSTSTRASGAARRRSAASGSEMAATEMCAPAGLGLDARQRSRLAAERGRDPRRRDLSELKEDVRLDVLLAQHDREPRRQSGISHERWTCSMCTRSGRNRRTSSPTAASRRRRTHRPTTTDRPRIARGATESHRRGATRTDPDERVLLVGPTHDAGRRHQPYGDAAVPQASTNAPTTRCPPPELSHGHFVATTSTRSGRVLAKSPGSRSFTRSC